MKYFSSKDILQERKKKSIKRIDSAQTEVLCQGNQAPPLERRAGRNHLAAATAAHTRNYLFLSGREILNWYNFASSSGSNSRCDPMTHLCPVRQAPNPGARGSALLPRGMLCRTAPDKDLGAAAPASRPTPAAALHAGDQQVWPTSWRRAGGRGRESQTPREPEEPFLLWGKGTRGMTSWCHTQQSQA